MGVVQYFGDIVTVKHFMMVENNCGEKIRGGGTLSPGENLETCPLMSN